MKSEPPWVNDANLALFTDLYELTMLQAYYDGGMDEEAVFSLFVRELPAQRNYLLACGIDGLLRDLEALRFDQDAIGYLRSLGHFSDGFLRWLADFRFTGTVHAVAEGTPVFANEPIVEVVAPIGQAQVIETLVMNQIHLQTVLASKAARIVAAAQGRAVVDFGPRRMHGTDAAIKAARAFHIAGVAATSNVLAGRIYGVPVSGTMAHSFVEACDHEADAFRLFTEVYPETVLLVDTYDTLTGVDRVIDLARRLGDDFKVRAIRLDSGDLAALAWAARKRLDEAGLPGVQIFASGGLDEYEIAALVEGGAPIDAFGVGTAMGVSKDVPCLDIAYKLTSYAGRGRLKLSTGKMTLPGRKQVFRVERDGRFTGDVIARADEDLPGAPLLRPVMRRGKRLSGATASLEDCRAQAADRIGRLPEAVRGLDPADPAYPVEVSPALERYRAEVERQVTG